MTGNMRNVANKKEAVQIVGQVFWLGEWLGGRVPLNQNAVIRQLRDSDGQSSEMGKF
jgi:hypothetical protein